MFVLIDVFLVASIILIGYLGWSAGLTRSFFAALAGFLSVFAANKYPYQEGIYFYVVFLIVTLAVFMAGGFFLRLVNFFYMNIVDKTGGAVLSVVIWSVVCVNVIIPTLTYGTRAPEGSRNTVYKIISLNMQKSVPFLRDYVPPFIEKKAFAKDGGHTRRS